MLNDSDRKYLIESAIIRRVFPFNDINDVFCYLIDRGIVTFEEYKDIRERYYDVNPYLPLFDLDNTLFGRRWAEKHLRSLDSRIKKSNHKRYDSYILLDNAKIIRIESKASRAANREKAKDGNLVEKAARFYSSEDYTTSFDHIKLQYADVFVLVGVWSDVMKYWVIPSESFLTLENTSRRDINGLGYHTYLRPCNIHRFDAYATEKDNIYETIVNASKGVSCDSFSSFMNAPNLFNTLSLDC
jgi:hypothetical protein